MFETLSARAAARAERKARAKAAALAEVLRETLPRGIAVTSDDAGVHLVGRGLSRRFALDAGLRWTILGLIK